MSTTTEIRIITKDDINLLGLHAPTVVDEMDWETIMQCMVGMKHWYATGEGLKTATRELCEGLANRAIRNCLQGAIDYPDAQRWNTSTGMFEATIDYQGGWVLTLQFVPCCMDSSTL